ncbi:uncharacterized protein LOC121372877 [Gigantopelta aegis]|uniref:uncharacterized protein LOC121372877 n=1 Tax=Gigantopelta aegis TaxID=1735272 RepID=UPI001B88DEF7|nr:uncharacterized protein LOC121372877 [Gigantopelta aegis]
MSTSIMYSFVSVLVCLYVAASLNTEVCPPPIPPGIPCEDNFPFQFQFRKRKTLPPVIDCRITGCPSGELCCADYCVTRYQCISSQSRPALRCPYHFSSRCSSSSSGHFDTCASNSDCSYGYICCTVNCQKKCTLGIPTAMA